MINLITILCYIIATFGICELIIYFDGPFNIIDKFRKIVSSLFKGGEQLVGCFACLSTWVGIILSLLNFLLIDIPFTPFNIIFNSLNSYWWLLLIIPLDAAFTCGTTWMLHQLEEYMENHKVYIYKDEKEDEYE